MDEQNTNAGLPTNEGMSIPVRISTPEPAMPVPEAVPTPGQEAPQPMAEATPIAVDTPADPLEALTMATPGTTIEPTPLAPEPVPTLEAAPAPMPMAEAAVLDRLNATPEPVVDTPAEPVAPAIEELPIPEVPTPVAVTVPEAVPVAVPEPVAEVVHTEPELEPVEPTPESAFAYANEPDAGLLNEEEPAALPWASDEPQPITTDQPAPEAVDNMIDTLMPNASNGAGVGKKVAAAAVVVLLLGVVGFGGFTMLKQDQAKTLGASTTAAGQDVGSLVEQIGKHVQLPTGESPVMATVVDKDKANQAFLVNSEAGDKLLIYKSAKFAVLYRPTTDRVINMGPVNVNEALAAVVRNGSGQNQGLTALTDKLKEVQSEVEVKATEQATKTYPKTLVIDVTGQNREVVRQLAAELNATIEDLPEGEEAPEAGTQILIIAGADQL